MYHPLNLFTYNFSSFVIEIFVIEKRLPSSASRGVADSPTLRVRESPILQLGESGSRFSITNISESGSYRLPNLPRRGVADSLTRRAVESPTRLVGESTTLRFTEEGSFRINIQKLTLQLAESGSRRLSASPRRGDVFRYENLREFKVKIGTARNVVEGTNAEPIYAKTSENRPHCHVPLKENSPLP